MLRGFLLLNIITIKLMKNSFYFFSYRPAIRYKISQRLLSLGWEKSNNASSALFTDKNLILNDEISKNLEYKHLLAALVSRHCKGYMPLTYCINDSNYPEVFAKIIYENYLANGQYQKNIQGLKWILKPSTLNNGDEIRLFNNIEELKKHYASANRLGGEHVVQQYIAEPDLIDKRKYTFRLPVILTNYAGVFAYQEGYINISAYPFDLEDNFVNRKSHLTNYVLDGDLAHIEQRSTNSLDDFSRSYEQMSSIVTCVIKALVKIAPDYLKPNKLKIFEIFGFDFIKDRKGKIWLLEINQGPDAPTFEDNVLDKILWDNFWKDIVEDFVLPIALDKPTKEYKHFRQLLKAKECYFSFSLAWFKRFVN